MESFETQDAAEKAAKHYYRNRPGRVIMEAAIEQYAQYMTAKGNKPASVHHTTWRINVWHDPDQPIESVTRAQLAHKYQERTERLAVDSHRGELAEVKTFWRWAVKRRLVRRSPAESIEPVGRRRRGKPQLRKSEAQAGDDGALGALAVLMLGLRSGEIRQRKVRDLDVTSNEVLLWIEDGKTQAATRHLEVPEPLAGLLQAQAADRKPQDWLFQSPDANAGHRGSTWLLKAVRRVCLAAGVPVVCPHGLRGTWATLTTAAGVSAHVVARELGHTSPTVTQQHYTRRGATEQAKSRLMLSVIEGGGEGQKRKKTGPDI